MCLIPVLQQDWTGLKTQDTFRTPRHYGRLRKQLKQRVPFPNNIYRERFSTCCWQIFVSVLQPKLSLRWQVGDPQRRNRCFPSNRLNPACIILLRNLLTPTRTILWKAFRVIAVALPNSVVYSCCGDGGRDLAVGTTITMLSSQMLLCNRPVIRWRRLHMWQSNRSQISLPLLRPRHNGVSLVILLSRRMASF